MRQDKSLECVHFGLFSKGRFDSSEFGDCWLTENSTMLVEDFLDSEMCYSCPDLSIYRFLPFSRTMLQTAESMANRFNSHFGIQQDRKITRDYDHSPTPRLMSFLLGSLLTHQTHWTMSSIR